MPDRDDNPKPYRPSNGSEFDWFHTKWCAPCIRDDMEDIQCPILLASFVNEPGDPDYPPEWQYSASGVPMCTGFQSDGEIPEPRCTETIDLFEDGDVKGE